MAPLRTKPRKTVDDYMKLPEGVRAELIEGEIYMSPSPRARHQRIVLNIAYALRQFVESRGLGAVYVAPMDVHLPTGSVVQPDVIYVASANLGIVQDWMRGTPDLHVEVLSPENPERDLVVKRRLYEENRVREYWIVDPAPETVEVLTLAGDKHEPHVFFQRADTLTSPLLPGFELPGDRIFA